ncbi:Transposase subfamily protein [Mameliella alba]|uniref:Transposase subfamily protein n=1 Tax=Mameliella alba TaxID=561184 RepID=A0A0B3S2M2_9RHOB|nr:Transposase subfamily protein [Mameliella alba]
MRKSRFSEGQVIGILKEHQAGIGTRELCRKHGIGDGTFYKWRSKSGGMQVSEAKRPKALEAENAQLKKMLAEQMLDVATLKVMPGKKRLKPGARRRAVDWARTEKSYSRECLAAVVDTSLSGQRVGHEFDSIARVRA